MTCCLNFSVFSLSCTLMAASSLYSALARTSFSLSRLISSSRCNKENESQDEGHHRAMIIHHRMRKTICDTCRRRRNQHAIMTSSRRKPRGGMSLRGETYHVRQPPVSQSCPQAHGYVSVSHQAMIASTRIIAESNMRI